MTSKQDVRIEIKHLRWLRRLSAFALILFTVGVFLSFSKKTEQQAQIVALIATAKSMQERLNQYHEYWLLNGQPSFVEIQGDRFYFDNKGWIIPLLNGTYDCNQLFKAAYPVQQQPEEEVISWFEQVDNTLTCKYQLIEKTELIIKKTVGYSVSVNILS